jgi:hypothetical protein
MANALTNVNDTIISQAAFDAFTSAISPMMAFSTSLTADTAKKGDSVRVLTVPAQDAAANFAGTYTMQDADATGVDVDINKHKFVSWALTDTEISNSSLISLERFGYQKGFQLAKAVLQDVWSVVTNANFANKTISTAANFDSDDVADIMGAVDVLNWPENMRSMILSSPYYTALIKDNTVQGTLGVGGSEVLRSGVVGQLHGFDLYKSNLIPANAENLTGIVARPEAMAVAMRYLAPQAGNKYFAAGPISDASGITIGFRDWYDEDTGTRKKVLECVYGYKVINGSALYRIVSA